MLSQSSPAGCLGGHGSRFFPTTSIRVRQASRFPGPSPVVVRAASISIEEESRMRPPHIVRTVLFGALIALGMTSAPARAAFVATESTTVTASTGGSYLYSYTIAVAPTSTVAATEFDLQLNAAIDPNSIISPSDFFTFYTPGDPFITFTAFDNGIAPGSSGTFSFTSTVGPGMGGYSTSGLDNSNFSNPSVQGMTFVPGVTVPEPSSLLLTGLGACGALGGYARSRRRSPMARG